MSTVRIESPTILMDRDAYIPKDENMTLIYKHSYGTMDLLGAQIEIFKDGEYRILNACFESVSLESLPDVTVGSLHTIVSFNKKIEISDDNQFDMYTKTYKIVIRTTDNPRPEDLFYF